MFSAAHAIKIRSPSGTPLPRVFKTLPFDLMRGNLILICAAPGIGKSVVSLNWAAGIKRPALYFSADSDHITQTSRLTSILTGRPNSVTKQEVRDGVIDLALIKSDVHFTFDAQPTLEGMEDSIKAFDQLYGDPPELIVVDNITDVEMPDTEDLNPLLGHLNEICRYTGAAMIGLHHVTGPYNDGDKPIPLSGIKGQVGRIPQGILTLHKAEPTVLGVSIVKDRGNNADPSGNTTHHLRFDGEHSKVTDF